MDLNAHESFLLFVHEKPSDPTYMRDKQQEKEQKKHQI